MSVEILPDNLPIKTYLRDNQEETVHDFEEENFGVARFISGPTK